MTVFSHLLSDFVQYLVLTNVCCYLMPFIYMYMCIYMHRDLKMSSVTERLKVETEYLALVLLTSSQASTAELEDLVLEQIFLFLSHSYWTQLMNK